jgi:putative transposase
VRDCRNGEAAASLSHQCVRRVAGSFACDTDLPPDNADFSTRWMLIKAGFSRHITMNERRNASRISTGERGIWQRRYWEHLIRDENDFERHVDYIHYNSVNHGYVHQANEWSYSSIHRYIKTGSISNDWGSDGER